MMDPHRQANKVAYKHPTVARDVRCGERRLGTGKAVVPGGARAGFGDELARELMRELQRMEELEWRRSSAHRR